MSDIIHLFLIVVAVGVCVYASLFFWIIVGYLVLWAMRIITYPYFWVHRLFNKDEYK